MSPTPHPRPSLIHDAPYVAQVYGGDGLASSPLALPGAKARAVEIFSFAKSYQMVSSRGAAGFDLVRLGLTEFDRV